jgi:hypothetical protein
MMHIYYYETGSTSNLVNQYLYNIVKGAFLKLSASSHLITGVNIIDGFIVLDR